MYPDLWDTVKAVFRNKLIAINVYIKKRFQISNLTFHLKEPEKEGHTKLKSSESEEIIKIKLQINREQKNSGEN